MGKLDNVGHNGNDLSRAIVIFTQYHHASWPHSDAAAVIAEFGPDRGAELAAEIAELLLEANGLPVDWANLSLAQGGDYMRSNTAARHPELSADALDAMRWHWTYGWR